MSVYGPYIKTIYPQPDSAIIPDQLFSVTFNDNVNFGKGAQVLALMYEGQHIIKCESGHTKEKGNDIFTTSSIGDLQSNRTVILVIKSNQMYSTDTMILLSRPAICIKYHVVPKQLSNSQSIMKSFETIRAPSTGIAPWKLVSPPPTAKQILSNTSRTKSSTQSSSSSSSTSLPSSSSSSTSTNRSDGRHIKRINVGGTITNDFFVDYESIETTIVTLTKLTPQSLKEIRLLLCFNDGKMDVITTVNAKLPVTLSSLKTNIADCLRVGISTEPERLLSIHLVLGPLDWFCHVLVNDDAVAGTLQNNDILKLVIDKESNFEVTRELSLEERLVVRFEEAKERGDFLDLEDDEEKIINQENSIGGVEKTKQKKYSTKRERE